MQLRLRDQPAELIKLIAGKIIDFQPGEGLEALRDHLRRATIRCDDISGNVILFDFDLTNRKFDASSPLDVEARLNDLSGNPLHAILYADRTGDLLALEVFPWHKWIDGIDIASLKPASFNDQGLSHPQ